MSSAICFKLDQSKIVSSGNGLNWEKQSTSVMLLTDLLIDQIDSKVFYCHHVPNFRAHS